MEEYFEIGQIVNTHGVRGNVKIKPFTDDIRRFDKLKTIYISQKNELIEFVIQEVKYSKNSVLLKLEGIDTVEEAENYRNCYVKINRKNAVKLEKDSYFIADLLNCEVFTENGDMLGKIDDVFSTGSNDVYVVKDELGKQILIPAIKSVVKHVDIENKKITINLIEGLI